MPPTYDDLGLGPGDLGHSRSLHGKSEIQPDTQSKILLHIKNIEASIAEFKSLAKSTPALKKYFNDQVKNAKSVLKKYKDAHKKYLKLTKI